MVDDLLLYLFIGVMIEVVVNDHSKETRGHELTRGISIWLILGWPLVILRSIYKILRSK